MKVLTLIQPFATLIAVNEKKFETRHWKPKEDNPIWKEGFLIHAGKSKQFLDLCDEEPFKSILLKHGYTKYNLPMGVILARTELAGYYKSIYDNGKMARLENKCTTNYVIDGNEYEFGDYTEGRFAWNLKNTKVFEYPIPAKGQQGLWNFILPNNLNYIL